MKTNSRFHRVVAFAFAAVFAVAAGWAKDYTWNAGSGNWEDAANWLADGSAATIKPGAGDAVVIPGAATAYTVTVNEPFSVGSLTVGSGDAGQKVTLCFNHREENSVAGAVNVRAGATITHTAQAAGKTEQYVIYLACGEAFTLDADGFVDVNSKGFPVASGPGFIDGNGYNDYRVAYASTMVAGHCYGSAACPTNCG